MWITTAAQLAEKLPMTAEELAAVPHHLIEIISPL